MNGSGGYYTKWNKTERDKYYAFTYTDIYIYIKIYNKIGTDWDIKNKLAVATGEAVGGDGWIRWRGFWGTNYLLLHDCDCILGQRLWCRAQEIQSIILTSHGV